MQAFTAIARHGGGWLSVVGGTALVGTFVTLALPAALGHAVDAVVAGDAGSGWLLLVSALIAAGVACEMLAALAGTACVAGTTAWLRVRLIRHVLDAGPVATQSRGTGDLVSRVSSNAVDAARAGPSAVSAVTAVLPGIGSLLFLAYLDVWLAVTFLVGSVGVAAVLRAFTRRTSEVVESYLRFQGRIAAKLSESLTGIRTIAAAGTFDREEQRILAELPDLHKTGRAAWRVLGRSSAQGALVGPAVLIAVLVVGGEEVVAGRITSGDLFAASRYAMIGAGLGGLTGAFGALAQSRAGVERIAEILAVPVVGYGDRALPSGGPGVLELRGATVDGLLTDVNLALPGGATVAVVGPSGAGKSVLAALAARLRDPDSGQVLLDGVPLRELSHAELRTAVGCAFDRPALVGRTVGDAIALGRPACEVVPVARAAHADEFVRKLPLGYDTALTDAPMSGGEIQRIGLARAWSAARLLVLDDATSSLDTVTEAQISETLLTGTGNGTGTGANTNPDAGPRTRLITTHRAATAARADLVVWLEAGRVRQVGPHTELWSVPEYRRVFG